MAAGLAALRHDDVGTLCRGIDRHTHVLDLAHEESAGILHASREGLRIAERKPNRTRSCAQGQIEETRLPRQAPGDEADPEGLALRVVLLDLRQFALEPRSVAVAGAEEAETARLCHRERKASIGHQ